MKQLTIPDTVLLVTASYDQAAGLVEKALTDSGEKWFRLDTDKFPGDVKSSYSPRSGFAYWKGTNRVESSEIKAVWYRRNVSPELPPTTDEHHREFCGREQKAYIEGTLATLNGVRWLSHPSTTARAELKLLQLSIAHDIGFVTPLTATTNDPGTVSEMSQDHELVAKAVRSGYVNSPEGFRAMFTTQLSEEDLAELDGLALAPATFQEIVPKKSDIRVTVVGPKIFAAEILSQERESSLKNADDLLRGIFSHMGNVGIMVFSYDFAACCNSAPLLTPLLAPLCVPFCISSRHPHSVCGECVGLFGRWSLIAPALEDLGHGWMAGGVIALWYALGGMGVGDRGSGLRDGGAGLAVCGQVAEVEGDCLGLGGH